MIDISAFFTALTPEERVVWRIRYILLLRQNRGTAEPKVNPITKKKIEPVSMCWMDEAWINGLNKLTEIMQQKGEHVEPFSLIPKNDNI